MGAERPPYPIDKTLGIIRPVFVTLENFPNQDPYARRTHFHHLNFEDGRVELQGSMGRALRYSAGQRLPAEMHFNIYRGSLHRALRQPEDLPTTEAGQHRSAMLHVGRVISRQAVELTGDGSYVDRQLSDDEHAFLSNSKITYIENGHKKRSIFTDHRIGRTFVEYAVRNYLDTVVTSKQMDRFLKARASGNSSRQQELGNLLIRNAVDESINSVRPYYDIALSHEMVSPGQPKLRTAVLKLIPEHEHPRYYEDIETALRKPEVRQELLAA